MPLSPLGFASGAAGGAEGAMAAGGARGRAGRGRSVPGRAVAAIGGVPSGSLRFRVVLCGAERCCRCYAEPWGPPLRGGGRDGAAWVPAAPTACGTPVSECRRPPSWGARAPLTPSPEESWAQPRTPSLSLPGSLPLSMPPLPSRSPAEGSPGGRAAPVPPSRPSPSAAPGLLRVSPRFVFASCAEASGNGSDGDKRRLWCSGRIFWSPAAALPACGDLVQADKVCHLLKPVSGLIKSSV